MRRCLTVAIVSGGRYATSLITTTHESIDPGFLTAKLIENVHGLSYAEFVRQLKLFESVFRDWVRRVHRLLLG